MKNKPLFLLDTNIFIYFFEGKGTRGKKSKTIFQQLANNQAQAVTSIITK